MTDIERLSREFAEWKDEQIKHNRYVDDLLENLDENNFSASFKQYIFNTIQSSAGFEVVANSDGAMARMFAEYETKFNSSLAEIRAVANAQGASITSLAEWKSEAVSAISSITQQVSSQGASIQSIVDYNTQFASDVDGRITSVTSRVTGLEEATSTYAKASEFATFRTEIEDYVEESVSGYEALSTEDKATLSLFSHYYNGQNTTAADIVLSASNGESTIKMNADRISFGDFAYVSGNSFYVKRLMGTQAFWDGEKYQYTPGQFYMEITSMPQVQEGTDRGGDLYVRDTSMMGEPILYGFTYGKGDTGEEYDVSDAVQFVVKDKRNGGTKPIIGYNYNNDATYPKGNWDFSSANVTGMKVYFS